MFPARCLLPILAAAPACATTVILANATVHTWRIRPEHPASGAPTLLLRIRPGQPPELLRVGPESAQADIELVPEAELHFLHEEGPDTAVSRWFEIDLDERTGGYLHFHSDPPWLGGGPHRPVLFGSFYAAGRRHPFRFIQAADARLVLEPAPGAGPPLCLIQ